MFYLALPQLWRHWACQTCCCLSREFLLLYPIAFGFLWKWNKHSNRLITAPYSWFLQWYEGAHHQWSMLTLGPPTFAGCNSHSQRNSVYNSVYGNCRRYELAWLPCRETELFRLNDDFLALFQWFVVNTSSTRSARATFEVVGSGFLFLLHPSKMIFWSSRCLWRTCLRKCFLIHSSLLLW